MHNKVKIVNCRRLQPAATIAIGIIIMHYWQQQQQP